MGDFEMTTKRGFLTEKELLKWVGERCPEQEAGCPICKAWARHDMINHMRFEDENMRIELEFDFGGGVR
jgi:hypothetical protein